MKPHTTSKRAKNKPRKFQGYCEKCGKVICECKAYIYVNSNNEAITNSSPYLCKKCYEEEYNEHIYTEGERLKTQIINSLYRQKEIMGIKAIKIENLIKFIENIDID